MGSALGPGSQYLSNRDLLSHPCTKLIITTHFGFLPVFDLIRSLHCINIHTNLELDMRWDAVGPRVHVYEDKACPELAVL